MARIAHPAVLMSSVDSHSRSAPTVDLGARIPTARLPSVDIVRATAIVVGVILLLALLWVSREIILTTFLGVLFGLAVASATDHLERWRVPRGLGAALVVFSFVGVLYGVGALIAPTLAEQGRLLRQRVPEAVDRIEAWMHERPGLATLLLGGRDVSSRATASASASADSAAPDSGSPPAPRDAGGKSDTATPAAAASARAAADSTDAIPTLRGRVSQQLSGVARYLFPFLSSTVTVVAGLLLILVLAIYIGASPRLYRDGMLQLVPLRSRARAREVLRTMSTILRKWLVTQLVAMVVIGVVTTVTLTILGVKSAFALGVIAGILEFVPTIGPILSAVPAIAMAFLDSPEKALSVAIAYLVIQQAEGNVLIPVLMKEGMDLPPALTLVAQAIMALVFGFLGLLVAVPLLAAVVVPIRMLYVQKGSEDAAGSEDGVAESAVSRSAAV